MPLPASLIASIISAVIETASQGSTSSASLDAARYEAYSNTRTLPPEAKLGVMQPPAGDGFVYINDQSFRLSPAAQFRNQRNLIVMPMTIQSPKDVVYVTEASGAIYRVWMLNPSEISVHQNN